MGSGKLEIEERAVDTFTRRADYRQDEPKKVTLVPVIAVCDGHRQGDDAATTKRILPSATLIL